MNEQIIGWQQILAKAEQQLLQPAKDHLTTKHNWQRTGFFSRLRVNSWTCLQKMATKKTEILFSLIFESVADEACMH